MTEHDCEKINQRITDNHSDIHKHIRMLGEKTDKQHEIVNALVEQFQHHEAEDSRRNTQFIESQTLNTKAINDLAHSVEGIVEAYRTANGVGKFIKWFGGIAISIGALIAYFK